MQEQLQFVMGELRSALRFRWIGLFASIVVSLSGWVYVASLPDIYQAQARFFLDTSSMLERAFASEIISVSPDARLAYIRESLFGREQLEAVARRVGLDADVVTAIDREYMLDRLRDEIIFIELNPEEGDESGNRVYQLRYHHQDRDTALAVVQALLDTFVEGALGESRRDEDDALESVEIQISQAETELESAEEAISEFKRQNADRLPGAEGEFQRRMSNEQEALALAQRRLRSLESTRAQQTGEINRMEASAASLPPPPGSLEAQIRARQQELDERSLNYTENHPDVIELTSIVRELRRQQQQELDEQGLDRTDLALLSLEANTLYQEAKLALLETEAEIAGLEAEIRERESELAELRELRDESFENEKLLATLERERSDADSRLSTLYERRLSINLTREVALANPMDFRPIDQPYATLDPVEPNRLKLLVAVFVGALGLGAAICYGLAQIRPVFSNAQSLRRFVELPVLGTVANAWPAQSKSRFIKSTLLYLVALTVLVVMLAGLIGIEMFGPGIHTPFNRG